jgi:nucleotide-binding universal stress UspA family protein
MYERLLVPVDETAETTRLIERAIELADTWDAAVHAVGLVDGPSALNAEATGRADRVRGERERACRASMRAAERVQRAGVEAHRTVRRGVPHAEIVDEARRVDTDLVLLGPPGRETTDGAVCTGQVTRHVVDRADCAVLVEQSGDEQPEESGSGEPVADAAGSSSPSAAPSSASTREESTDEKPLLVGSR